MRKKLKVALITSILSVFTGFNSQIIAQTEEVNMYDVINIDTFIYDVTDFINEYKSFTANYLANNKSISSVPRNAEALITRHVEWLKNFEKLTAEYVQKMDVKDETTYRTALDAINQFRTKIVSTEYSDNYLNNTENDFIKDVEEIKESIIYLKSKANKLITQKELTAFIKATREDGENLKAQLSGVEDVLLKNYKYIEKQCNLLRHMENRRFYLKTSVPALWERNIDRKLMAVNRENGAKLIENIKKALEGPYLRAEISSALSGYKGEINKLISIYYSPKLARRMATNYIANIEKYNTKIDNMPFTDNMREAIKKQLNMQQTEAESLFNNANDNSKNIEYYNTRIKRTKLYLDKAGKNNIPKLTGECKELGDKIIKETDSQTAKTEILFVEFRKNCVK